MSPQSRLHGIRVGLLAMGILATGILASCGKAPKQMLRLGLVPGNNYVLTVRTSSDAVIETADGNSIPVPANGLNTFNLQAGDVDAQGNTFVSAQFGASEFPLVFVPLAAIVEGYSFGFKLSPVGTITEFVNTEPLRQAVHAALASMGDGTTSYGSTTPDEAVARISDDALRAIIEPLTTIWPQTPVTSGDEWSGPPLYTPSNHTLMTTKYTMKSLSDSDARIAVTAEIQPATDRERDQKLPSQATISGKGAGEIRVDSARGLIRSYEAYLDVAGTIRAANGVELKTSGKTRVQAELIAR